MEIKPTYISFEQAKWLKEKAFEIDTEEVLFYRDEINNIEEHQIKNRDVIYNGSSINYKVDDIEVFLGKSVYFDYEDKYPIQVKEYFDSFFIVDFIPTSENLCQWLYESLSLFFIDCITLSARASFGFTMIGIFFT